MAKQLYDTGDVIQAGVTALEVTGVTYQEVDGEKVKFAYTVRPQSELNQERADEAARLKEIEDAEAAAAEEGTE
jgi:hypothetical protein